MAGYLAILTTLVLATALLGAALWLSWRIGPALPRDDEAASRGDRDLRPAAARRHYATRSFGVATLVVVLSVWMVFFQPWAVVFRAPGLPGFLAIGFFSLPLVVGLAYEWRKGGLDG